VVCDFENIARRVWNAMTTHTFFCHYEAIWELDIPECGAHDCALPSSAAWCGPFVMKLTN
jgi:hypothetical protein